MKVVIGIDSGGSNTRALAVSLDGERVGYGESGGGNPQHDRECRANVREAIARAAEGCGIGSVVRVVAGIAGCNGSGDETWAADATDVPGLGAARTHLNDAEVAHFGALSGGPGIVSVQGTGSMILAILEDGRRVRNMDFGHYARGGAVSLGMQTAFSLMTEPSACDDGELLGAARAIFGAEDLRGAILEGEERWSREWSRRYGALARATTRSAEAGSRFAGGLCREAAGEIVQGIRLLGPMFVEDEVAVAPIGACVRSGAVRREVSARLAEATEKRYRLVDPASPPVVGAVLMALAAEGVVLSEEARRGLA